MRGRDLDARLTAYVPRDSREATFRDCMLVLLREDGAFERTHFAPGHFTASAFVLSPEQDSLLLIFHKKLSLWLQPGGHVEPTDGSILAAARREVREEVGLPEFETAGGDAALFDLDIHPIPARKDEPAHEHFDVRFLFQARSRDFSASDEVAGARWVPLADLGAVTSDESVLRAARQLG